MKFFIGLHHPSDARHFPMAMVSVNALQRRKSDFKANEWIMDSGAFSQIKQHGRHVLNSTDYLREIQRWRACGNLLGAVCQDWMCEPHVLRQTGHSVEEHQRLTRESYLRLRHSSSTYIMPVLQGYHAWDYVHALELYGQDLVVGQWVGVGSVCQRNGNPDAIEDVLVAIKRERPDLKLHGFGIKLTALQRATVRSLLYSADSMAWSYHGRRNGRANDPRLAQEYCSKVAEISKRPSAVQEQFSYSGKGENAVKIAT